MIKKLIITLIIFLNIFHQLSYAASNYYKDLLDSKIYNEKNTFLASQILNFDNIKNARRNLIICDSFYENDIFRCNKDEVFSKTSTSNLIYSKDSVSRESLLLYTIIEGAYLIVIPTDSFESVAKLKEVNRFITLLEESEFLKNEKFEIPTSFEKKMYLTNQLFSESIDYVFTLTLILGLLHFIKKIKDNFNTVKNFYTKHKSTIFYFLILITCTATFVLKFEIHYYYSLYGFLSFHINSFKSNSITSLLFTLILILILFLNKITDKNILNNFFEFRKNIASIPEKIPGLLAPIFLFLILFFSRLGESSSEVYVLVLIIFLLSTYSRILSFDNKLSLWISISMVFIILTLSFLRYKNQIYLFKDLIDEGNFITLPKKLTINGTEKIKNQGLILENKPIFMESFLVYYPGAETIEIKRNDQFQVNETSLLTFKNRDKLFKFLNKNLENRDSMTTTQPSNIFYVEKYDKNTGNLLLIIEYKCKNNLYRDIVINDKKIANLRECYQGGTAKLSVDVSKYLEKEGFYEINFDNSDIKKVALVDEYGKKVSNILFYNVNKNFKYTLGFNLDKSNKIINYAEGIETDLILDNNFINNLNEISSRNLVENSFVIWSDQDINVIQNKKTIF
jgi:hypothetical protein